MIFLRGDVFRKKKKFWVAISSSTKKYLGRKLFDEPHGKDAKNDFSLKKSFLHLYSPITFFEGTSY